MVQDSKFLVPYHWFASPPKKKPVAEVAVYNLTLHHRPVLQGWLLDSLSLSSRGVSVDTNTIWIMFASREKPVLAYRWCGLRKAC